MKDYVEGVLISLKRLREKSYAPYSKYRVSAIVKGRNKNNGVIYGLGVNIENASYGLTMCAERSAIFDAVQQGMEKLDIVYIMTEDGLGYSCGACLQVMQEFCDSDVTIEYYDNAGILRNVQFLSSSLPYPFKLE